MSLWLYDWLIVVLLGTISIICVDVWSRTEVRIEDNYLSSMNGEDEPPCVLFCFYVTPLSSDIVYRFRFASLSNQNRYPGCELKRDLEIKLILP